MNHRVDEHELVWFLNYASGEMGLKSNFSSMVGLLECGGPCGSVVNREIDQRCVEAASRARPILKALNAVGPEAKRVLCAAYGEEQPTGLEVFGRCARLVLVSPRARQAWRDSSTARSFSDWMTRLSKRLVHGTSPNPARDRMLVREIVMDSERTLESALYRYALERGRQQQPQEDR